MKFTTVLALVAAATVVSAETNAQRMARGLSPNSPVKRATPAFKARRGKPSGTPNPCGNSGSLNCCNSVQQAGSSAQFDEFLSQLGILGLAAGTPVGTSCSPITGLGTGSGARCTQQTVCCENNNFNGLVNLGCTPININL